MSHYTRLASLPFRAGYVAKGDAPALLDELFFQRAVQTYLWALPAISMYGMKEGSECTFGRGYNVLPIFKQRVNAKTRIPTPNSDVIYALGYLDLKTDGPLVIEVPPGLQGILDDFWQRPIPSVGEIDGQRWSGDVGLAGPDRGAGGRYLLLPPDHVDEIPPGYFAYRSGTYGVLVLWRGFFTDPRNLQPPVRLMEQTRIHPLGKRDSARPMAFPDASAVATDMLYPQDGGAFDLLARFIQHEYVDPADREMRGMAAAIGIVRGRNFSPDAHARELLDAAARTATRMGHIVAYTPSPLLRGGLYYRDRHYINAVPGNATFTGESFNYLDARTGFFTYACSTSPDMAAQMENVGAKYPAAYTDADGDFLSGDATYRLRLPPGIPAALFWSVSVYDPVTGSGLDNGQPFFSINAMDEPVQNTDGSTDIYFAPSSPGRGMNWLRTIPGHGWFVIIRLYAPQKAFFDQSWKPDDIVRLR